MATPELVERLNSYVRSGAHSLSTADSAFLDECLDQAVAMVDNECGTAVDRVPLAVLHGCYIDCASELYQRRSAPQGVTQFASPDGGVSAVRTSRDPLGGVRQRLAPFIGGGFA